MDSINISKNKVEILIESGVCVRFYPLLHLHFYILSDFSNLLLHIYMCVYVCVWYRESRFWTP